MHGINAITGSGNPMDDNGHGTFCAGLIGAVGNNNVGLAGVNWSSITAVSVDVTPTELLQQVQAQLSAH